MDSQNRFAADQPSDSNYLTSTAVVPTAQIKDEHVWVRPLPSCAGMPPLPLPKTVSAEEYIGGWESHCDSWALAPVLTTTPCISHAGPTEESNWVIPGRVLVGAYPSSLDDKLNGEILTSILRLGELATLGLVRMLLHDRIVAVLSPRRRHHLRLFAARCVRACAALAVWSSH